MLELFFTAQTSTLITLLEKHCINVGVLALLHLHLKLSFLQNYLINLMEYELNTLKTILNI